MLKEYSHSLSYPVKFLNGNIPSSLVADRVVQPSSSVRTVAISGAVLLYIT